MSRPDWPASSTDSNSSSSVAGSSSSVSPLVSPASPPLLLLSPCPEPQVDNPWTPGPNGCLAWSWAEACSTGVVAAEETSSFPTALAAASQLGLLGEDARAAEQAVLDASHSSARIELLPSVRTTETAAVSAAPASASAASPRFYSRKVACQVCHFAKARCDGGRPCGRCSRLQLTQHCASRPSRRAAREVVSPEPGPSHKRLAVSATGLVSSPASTPSYASFVQDVTAVPCSLPRSVRASVLLRVDESNVSACLLACHFRAVSNMLPGASLLPMRLPMREKLLQHAWFKRHMTQPDLEAVAHAFVSYRRGRWYEGCFDPGLHPVFRSAAAKLAARAEPAASLQPSWADTRPPTLCDGRRCSGYCPFLRRLIKEAPCAYSWTASPETPIPDQPGFPSHAFLCIRHRPDDAAVEERQQLRLCQQAARLARQLLAEYSSAEAEALGEAWLSAEAAEDDSHTRCRDASAQPDGSLDCLPAACVRSDAACQPGPPASFISVSMLAQVNRAFERLLGFSQAEVRASFVLTGETALYALLRPDGWAELMDLTRQAKMLQRTEFRMRCTAVTRAQQELPCVLSAHYQREDGKVMAGFLSFIPLPDAASNARD